ncbi:glyoxalase superfamily protein [Devosia sp. MC1541]|uniref:glyoxalase superfamily protein n=1 Tax=Devosia sp. MC1541 TaxID=2725264 RepID=UPI00145D7733|nr:glyoxalase superfamily protein [Devosia sp. MC1541]
MSYSLDTPTATTLKSEAKDLRDSLAQMGQTLSHSAALEQIAQKHGFRDWNTARAALPERAIAPYQVGERVKGLYLEQAFSGQIIGVQMSGNMQSYTVTIQFDEPVNVTPTFMFAVLRHRVTATLDEHGFSISQRGNGNPQMQIFRR